MKKEIQYPTQEWLDNWVDKWLDAHPDEKVSDFKELNEQAEEAWWMNEIDHDRPTPFDLTAEQKKAQKEATKGMAKADKERKAVKRERKPNEEKRSLMENLAKFLTENGMADVVISNPEKTIDFGVGENRYSFTLTCHRKPKE